MNWSRHLHVMSALARRRQTSDTPELPDAQRVLSRATKQEDHTRQLSSDCEAREMYRQSTQSDQGLPFQIV
jgi:hypothetical protein